MEEHIKVEKPCPGCAEELLYNPSFDSYYCNTCNVWIGPVCTDPNCHYCINRPKTPN